MYSRGKQVGRRQQLQGRINGVSLFRFSSSSSFYKRLRLILILLAFVALLPPVLFHLRLRRFHQMQLRRCSWLNNPPLVCAHGGDSTNAFPNTISAYNFALHSQVDCIEIDVSRSSDGVLFALHDRPAGIYSGYLATALLRLGTFDQTRHIMGFPMRDLGPSLVVLFLVPTDSLKTIPLWEQIEQIKKLDVSHQSGDSKIPTIEDALRLISRSVRQVILDAKVGPPSYERGLAKDILSVVRKMQCKNCLIWAKSDSLVRDIIKLSSDVMVGYVVMVDPSTGARTNLLRMKGARVVGVYHPLIDERLVKIVHGRKKKVYAWTVDDADSMTRMLQEHADAIVTSNPSLLQRVMQDKRTQCLEEGFSLTR